MQSTRTACWVAAAMLNGGLNLYLIPRHGLTGALVTTGISELFLLGLVPLAVRHCLQRADERERAAAPPAAPTGGSPTDARLI